MGTGFRGAYVIAWSQVSVEYDPGDGAEIAVGLSFRWTGRPVRMDGPPDVFALGAAEGRQRLQARAGRIARRVIVPRDDDEAPRQDDTAHAAPRNSFVVTDGRRRLRLLLVEAGPAVGPLLLCEEGVPPAGTLLRVVEITGPGARVGLRAGACRDDEDPVGGLAEGTLIRTPSGLCPVEKLVEGDPVATRAGARPLLGVERCRVSGARMLAYPHTRPVRIRAGALGPGRPERDLVVASGSRLVLRGPAASALFGAPEALAAARDLIDDRGVGAVHSLRETVYVRLQFDGPQLIWANGAGCESAPLSGSAGPPCRVLAGWEVALLRHGLRAGH